MQRCVWCGSAIGGYPTIARDLSQSQLLTRASRLHVALHSWQLAIIKIVR